jgi:hypothetical protein
MPKGNECKKIALQGIIISGDSLQTYLDSRLAVFCLPSINFFSSRWLTEGPPCLYPQKDPADMAVCVPQREK